MSHCDNPGRIRSALTAAAETHAHLEPCAIEPQECPAQKAPEVEATCTLTSATASRPSRITLTRKSLTAGGQHLRGLQQVLRACRWPPQPYSQSLA